MTMRNLTDVMSHSGLAIYAEIALVLFALVFVAIVGRVLSPKHRDEFEAARRLPLEDGSVRPGDPS